MTEPKSALEQFREAMGGGSAIPGLESVNDSDLTIPTIQINHKNGTFVDKLSGQETKTLDGVLLGLLKSRIMWPPQQSAPGQKPMPLCRSRDAITGTPGDAFPWAEWKEGTKKNEEWSPEPAASEHVACATCYFAQWGSDPKRDASRCALQYVFPIVAGDDASKLTGLVTMQRSAIKPANAYISSFVRDGLPLFTHRTTLTLEQNRNGSVDYAVPKFVRGEATPNDVDLWKNWSKAFSKIQASLVGRDLGDSLVDATPTSDDAPKGAKF